MRAADRDAILLPVKLRIRYETVYRYDRAVNFSRHDLRIIPRSDSFMQVRRLHLASQPPATVRMSRDVFDNTVASFFFANASERLGLKMTADVEVAQKNPFDFILVPAAVELPFVYEKQFAPLLRVYCRRQTRDAISIPNWEQPSAQSPHGTVATLSQLTQTIHAMIAYERREEGSARLPS